MAGSKEDFEVWEGWVHSRMRLLIKARRYAHWAVDAAALPACWGGGRRGRHAMLPLAHQGGRGRACDCSP